MKVSRNWLQTFFDAPLPDADALAELFTFHSSEVDGVEDGVLDVSVLPDKSAWLLSHRGVAKELATIMDVPLAHDPLAETPVLEPLAQDLSVSLATEKCARYVAARITGVTVGPSPEWLRTQLEAIGQRSINNVVDATNYVMFHLGQPLHAFDAGKVEGGVGVRMARAGEEIVTLSGDTFTLSADDMLIVDGADTPIGIAGVKGGMHAAVSEQTTEIILESANFDRVTVRKTSQCLKLRTDASARYENGVVPELAGYGIVEGVRLICELAGGTLEGYRDVFPEPSEVKQVSVSLAKINSLLGLSLSMAEVEDVFRRFGYPCVRTDEVFTVTPPFERDDLLIPEDLVEEVGRMHGLAHVPSVVPEAISLAEYNKRFFYAEAVRDVLMALGFSEVYTSSFRDADAVCLENALASDKGCLRSSLRKNLEEALVRNVPNKDLLGLPRIALFEIGTVFEKDGEHFALGFGVRTDAAYSPKKDDPHLNEAMDAVAKVVGAEHFDVKDGIAELNLDAAIADLPDPEGYASVEKVSDVSYTPFSLYPHVSRDIALWVEEGTTAEDVEEVLKGHAGPLCVRLTLFDEFQKDGRTSYAFRLVFQSNEKTLTDADANEIMDRVASAANERGWAVR